MRARLSRQAGIVLLVAAGLNLLGWLVEIPVLVSILPHWAPMTVNTSLSFLLLGITFLLPRGRNDSPGMRAAARVCAGFAGLLAAATLTQFTAGLPLDVNALFVKLGDRFTPGLPVVMSAASATGILLIAVSALFVDWRTSKDFRPSLVLAPIAGTIGLVGTICHVYDGASLYTVPYFTGLSMPTSVLLLIASVGILGVHPDKGPLGVLASDGRGSQLARRLLPFALVLPVLIGWARLQGERAGFYEFEFGLALFATASVLVFCTMIWLTGTSLNREDILKRRADEALEHDAVRRRILFEQAKDGILVLGPDHKVVEANTSFSQLIGYAPAAIARLHPWDWIVDSRTREYVVSDWTTMAREGATFEAELRRRDGSLLDAEVSCTAATIDGQQFLFFVCRDITQRKRAQADLHASEQRFRRALANIPDVVVLYDTDLRIQYVNNATRGLTGKSPEELLGKRDEDVLPPEVCETYLPALRKAFLTKQICAIESDVDMPGIGQRSLRITCVPLLDRDGEVREVLGVTRDFTVRKRAEQAIRASEQKFRELIEQAADGIMIGDAEGRVELVNGRCCQLLGVEEATLLGRSCADVLAGADPDTDGDEFRNLTPGRDLRFERLLARTDGTRFPAEISITVLESGAQQVRFQDITSRYQQEQKLERLGLIRGVTSSINAAILRLRNRDELLAETCRVAVQDGRFSAAWIGVIDDDNGELTLTAQSGLGEASEELLGQAVELVPEGATERAIFGKQATWENVMAERGHSTPIRALAASQGAESLIALPLVVEGDTYGILVLYASETDYFHEEEQALLRELAHDVAFGIEFIAKEERVDYLAYYDMMTGLPNRSLFFNRLSRQLQEAQDRDERTVLGLFDIDRFRMINDTYGRHEGDAVIAEVAQRLLEAVNDTDTVARISANTFAVAITDEWDDADIGHRLEQIDDAVFAAAFRIDEEDVRVTATNGAAVYPDDAESPEGLLGNAEAALRNAKSRTVRRMLYSRDMNERVAESLRFENKVRAAVENGELAMWYQPKVCATTGELRGLEALMRWKDPETGAMVPPDKFIPVMEHTGCILEAGRWALQRVAGDCLQWQAQGVAPPRVAVNVSPIQLAQQNLVGSLVEAQIVAQSAGTAIDLEITESVIMDNVDEVIPRLRTLHSVGTRIHVDDFGTGYSSLSYISKLPIQALKIDRSFVSDLHAESDGLDIVRTIISLAKAMKLQVIAEGVETQEQVELLRNLHCDELQGYYIGRPLPQEDTLGVIQQLAVAATKS